MTDVSDYSDDLNYNYEDPDDYDDYDDYPPGWDTPEPDFDLAAEQEHFDRFHPGSGVCNCRPPLRQRIAWRLSEWRRRLRVWLGRDHYDDPPF